MAATWEIVRNRVGEGGSRRGRDVRALQQLLIAAGCALRGGADGTWGNGTATALQQFQQSVAREFVGPLPPGAIFVRPYVVRDDPILLTMAERAGILIPMSGHSALAGLQEVHDWFVSRRIRYNPGAERGEGDRAIYGVARNERYAIQRIRRAFRAGPLEMDCTTYLNLQLSVFRQGHAHREPYDARCADFGGQSRVHCARDRYSMHLIRGGTAARSRNYFGSAAEIRTALSASTGRLYALEVGAGAKGAVTHMALLLGAPHWRIYECTTGQAGSACITRSLEAFMANKTRVPIYLFGPA